MRIPAPEALAALAAVLPPALLWLAWPARGAVDGPPLEVAATDALRGLGVVFLLLGHFAYVRVAGTLPFTFAGEWAVVVFLLASGVGLAASHGGRIRAGAFVRRRAARVLVPFWVVVLAGAALEAALGRRAVPAGEVVRGLLGAGGGAPNEHLWFVSYLVFWYGAYLAAAASGAAAWRPAALAAAGLAAAVAVLAVPALGRFAISAKYALVFPLGVLVGANRERLAAALDDLRRRAPVAVAAAVALAFLAGAARPFAESLLRAEGVRQRHLLLLSVLLTLLLGAALAALARLAEGAGVRFPNLGKTGRLSYEIYLVHWALLVHYDALLVRRPLAPWLALHLCAVVAAALALRAAVRALLPAAGGAGGGGGLTVEARA